MDTTEFDASMKAFIGELDELIERHWAKIAPARHPEDALEMDADELDHAANSVPVGWVLAYEARSFDPDSPSFTSMACKPGMSSIHVHGLLNYVG